MSNNFTVLVIDDDENHRRLILEVLSHAECDVVPASAGNAGIRTFSARPAHLVLLDLGLPDTDGTAVCRTLRTLPGGSDAFILLLSGRRDLADRVAGFHAGADDFLTKPVDIYELKLRVLAIRRRYVTADSSPPDVQVGSWRLDYRHRSIERPDGSVALTPAEFQLMSHLMQHHETLCTAESLLCEVWRYPPGTGSPDLVRFHVRNLRKKLERNPDQPERLVSVPHHGYMLRVPHHPAHRAQMTPG
jgi:DNA-binding response OmpR family regulator